MYRFSFNQTTFLILFMVSTFPEIATNSVSIYVITITVSGRFPHSQDCFKLPTQEGFTRKEALQFVILYHWFTLLTTYQIC